jgi:hypothetical protein
MDLKWARMEKTEECIQNFGEEISWKTSTGKTGVMGGHD